MDALKKLREPFPAHQISKLPKPTKAQTEAVKADFKKGIRCQLCGTWHHPDVVHLDYVGHAALTDRLLDTDPSWVWEPLSMSPDGLPVFDGFGGMWIKLTVCGVTRLGYGAADGKDGPNAIKEVIGDALRNAAMRFGAALDLWHKGDLHAEEPESMSADVLADWLIFIEDSDSVGTLKARLAEAEAACRKVNDTAALAKVQAAAAAKLAKAKTKVAA
jgi:hypothetical protein